MHPEKGLNQTGLERYITLCISSCKIPLFPTAADSKYICFLLSQTAFIPLDSHHELVAKHNSDSQNLILNCSTDEV